MFKSSIVKFLSVNCLLMIFGLILQTEAKTEALDLVDKINNKHWIHGQSDCTQDTEPPIDILRLTESTYILRQNKCLHYEAPFMYLLLGTHSALLLDTGATSGAKGFPLQRQVKRLLHNYQQKLQLAPIKLIVAHSHSHSDHYAADGQFRGLPDTQVVKPDTNSVVDFFKFDGWPDSISQLELGGRTLSLISIPGHQKDSIAIYDLETQLMLTGDSFYPGRLYIRDWGRFSQSIEKLVSFSQTRNVVGFLGAHIEMSKSGVDYPVGTSYQPEEVDLLLNLSELEDVLSQIKQLGDSPSNRQVGDVILYPVE